MQRVLAALFVALLLAFSFVTVNTVAAQTDDATPVDVEATPVDEDDVAPTEDDTDTGEETDTSGTGGTAAESLPNTGAGTEQGVGGMSTWLIAALLLVATIAVAIPFRLRRNA